MSLKRLNSEKRVAGGDIFWIISLKKKTPSSSYNSSLNLGRNINVVQIITIISAFLLRAIFISIEFSISFESGEILGNMQIRAKQSKNWFNEIAYLHFSVASSIVESYFCEIYSVEGFEVISMCSRIECRWTGIFPELRIIEIFSLT